MAEITEIEKKTVNMDFIFCTEKKTWSDFEKEIIGIATVE